MRILYSTNHLYRPGGIEKVISLKVNYLARLKDTKVYIITTGQKGRPPFYAIDSRIELLDLEINYDRKESFFSRKNVKKSFRHYKKQKRVIKELNPDIIIVPNYSLDYFWLPFIRGKAFLIKEQHNSGYRRRVHRGFYKGLRTKLEDWILKKYDRNVVLNSDEKRYFPASNVEVIPNPVASFPHQAKLNKKQVMAAGRIAPVKGFEQLIEIWRDINSEFPDWELHIYGENYIGTQEYLQQKIEAVGLQEVIMFKGVVSNISEKMMEYSLYVMTSHSECFPLVLLEALSVGLPLVVYDCPNGPRHIVTDQEDGILVPDKDALSFKKALAALMNHPELRRKMGEAGQRNVRRFAVDRIMEKWMRVYGEES